MNNFIIKREIKLTDEQIARLDALSEMSDEEIDYSDIPKMTKEELKNFKPARFRRKNLKIA